MRRAVLIVCLASWAQAARLHATEEQPGLPDRAVAVLGKYCLRCHGDDFRYPGLDFRDRPSLLRPRDEKEEPFIVPGKASASRIWTVMEHGDPQQMPPETQAQTERRRKSTGPEVDRHGCRLSTSQSSSTTIYRRQRRHRTHPQRSGESAGLATQDDSLLLLGAFVEHRSQRRRLAHRTGSRIETFEWPFEQFKDCPTFDRRPGWNPAANQPSGVRLEKSPMGGSLGSVSFRIGAARKACASDLRDDRFRVAVPSSGLVRLPCVATSVVSPAHYVARNTRIASTAIAARRAAERQRSDQFRKEPIDASRFQRRKVGRLGPQSNRGTAQFEIRLLLV